MSPSQHPDQPLLPASIGPATSTATGPTGQLAHQDQISHTARLSPQLYEVADGVWSMVGNGLSNQNFVLGPDGLVVIDTGESRQELRHAMAQLRQHTDAPVAAVIYTHFHYVAGTAALFDGGDDGVDVDRPPVPVWGHERIPGNRARVGVELSAAAGRGLVEQFGMQLPAEGPDGLVNCGLGLFYRNPRHAPFTDGYLPPTHTVSTATTITVAGLEAQLLPAPSDADDSLTVWFPELGVVVNNLLWPALFNIFAIRGEEYRDPQVLITGLEQLAGLGAAHLLGCHGPPMSGAEDIAADSTLARDAIQYLWDQTVRGINQGLSAGQLVEAVQLPDLYHQRHVTSQLYGLAEHHVRQIHSGLRGWFDGDEAHLLPLPPTERAVRLVDGFGGPERVREQRDQALVEDDVRWAIELATWLVRLEDHDDADRHALAAALRTAGYRTTSANIRNWCLTRALEWDGTIDLTRYRTHRFHPRQVRAMDPAAHVRGLRVLLVPERAAGLDVHLGWSFAEGTRCGLHLRRGVAVPTDGRDADHQLALDLATWADVVGGRVGLGPAIDAGLIDITGDRAVVERALGCFDLPGLSGVA